jgi:hypothetical protein
VSQIPRWPGSTVGARLPAKNRLCVRRRFQTLPGLTVGAGLLANRGVTTTPMLPDPAPSRASALLQVMRPAQISEVAWTGCRSACPRKYQPATSPNLTHRVRQQAGSYRFACVAHFKGCPDLRVSQIPRLPGSTVGARLPAKNRLCVRRRFRTLYGSTVGAGLLANRCGVLRKRERIAARPTPAAP